MNVLIAEDETYTAELLKGIIEEKRDFLVVKIVESIVDAVDYLIKHQHKLDLLFFDIHLADGLSFDIFNHVDVFTPIIFCTAYDDYSMKAIRNNGIDYILKPFTNEEIYKALSKYQKLVSGRKSETPVIFRQETVSFQQHFLCQFKERTIIVGLEEIAYFHVENEVTYLHTYENKTYPLFKKLEYIESVVNPQQFFRINRQILVNKKTIKSYAPYFNRRLVLDLSLKIEDKVIVSRSKVSDFKSWLEL